MHSPAPSTSHFFLRPDDIASIASIEVRARTIVEGMIAGMHKSPFHGFSAEFLEYRPYRSGESTSRIDWRAYARTERAVVRLYEDETNCPVTLILDKSASMNFTYSAPVTKFDYARTLCAATAWLLHGQRDAVGLCAFNERIQTSIPPRASATTIHALLRALQTMTAGESTHCARAIGAAALQMRRRGMCIIISDLLDDPESIAQALKHVRFKKQDIILLHVLDPFESEFALDAVLDLTDRESGRRILLDSAVARQFQQEGMAAHCAALEHTCRTLHIDYERVSTAEPFARALMRVVEKRKRQS